VSQIRRGQVRSNERTSAHPVMWPARPGVAGDVAGGELGGCRATVKMERGLRWVLVCAFGGVRTGLERWFKRAYPHGYLRPVSATAMTMAEAGARLRRRPATDTPSSRKKGRREVVAHNGGSRSAPARSRRGVAGAARIEAAADEDPRKTTTPSRANEGPSAPPRASERRSCLRRSS
jgi:hypothetical protein